MSPRPEPGAVASEGAARSLLSVLDAGGANLSYVLSLVGANVSMDLATFTSLPSSVVLVSSVRVLHVSSMPPCSNIVYLPSLESQR